MKAVDNITASFKMFMSNVVALVIASVITMVGSMFIIPMPPLLFGMYCMAGRVVKGEKTEIGDVFKGFSYFVKSWVYLILVGVIGMLGVIVYVVLLLLSLMTKSGILTAIAFLALLAGVVWFMVVALLQIYAIPLIVNKGLGSVAALKESVKIFKRNIVDSIVLLACLMVASLVLNMLIVGMFIMPSVMAIALTKAALEA